MLKRRILQVGLAIFVVALSFSSVVMGTFFVRPTETSQWYTSTALELMGMTKVKLPYEEGEMSYFVGGQGPPVVFIHGLRDHSGSWYKVVEAMADDHRIYLIDLPGHGESTFPGEDAQGDVFTGAFKVLDLATEDEAATLIGNSLGGWVSMKYALERPERVKKIIPVGSAGLKYKVDRGLVIPSDRGDVRRSMEAVYGDGAPQLPGFMLDRIMDHTLKGPADVVWERLRRDALFIDDRLPELTTPTELVWGTRDDFFPLEYAYLLNEGLPNSRLHIIDGCGHAPQVGCPDEFISIVATVLSEP